MHRESQGAGVAFPPGSWRLRTAVPLIGRLFFILISSARLINALLSIPLLLPKARFETP